MWTAVRALHGRGRRRKNEGEGRRHEGGGARRAHGGKRGRKRPEFIFARASTERLVVFNGSNWVPAVDPHAAATTIKTRTDEARRPTCFHLAGFLPLQAETQGSRWRGIPGERRFLSWKGLKKISIVKRRRGHGEGDVSPAVFGSFGSRGAAGPSGTQGRRARRVTTLEIHVKENESVQGGLKSRRLPSGFVSNRLPPASRSWMPASELGSPSRQPLFQERIPPGPFH